MSMIWERIKKAVSVELLFYIFLVIVFLVLTGLLLIIAREQREKNRLLLFYEAERTMFSIGAALRNGVELEEALPKAVLGYGSYDSEGEALLRWGTAPVSEDSSVERTWETRFSLDREKQTLTLNQQIGRHPHDRERPPARRDESTGATEPYSEMKSEMSSEYNELRSLKPPRFLFLEIDTTGYWSKQRVLFLSLFLWIFFIVAVLGFVYFTIRRSSGYRNRLEMQKQLVHMGEAARTLSHEIKNPLSAIRLRTDILSRFTTEEGTEDLKIIREEVDRLRLLTDKIGDFLKNPQGSPELIDLDPFLRDVLTLYGDRIEFDNSDCESCVVSFDRERLRSVIDNVVQNALESYPHGGDVQVQLRSAKNRVNVSILDRGRGIAPQIRDQVFDPLFTTKTRGSGIGLAICKRFVEAVGGTISLSPRDGGGTEVTVTLKRARR
jgi:two-component system sensor histidine kinase HydH